MEAVCSHLQDYALPQPRRTQCEEFCPLKCKPFKKKRKERKKEKEKKEKKEMFHALHISLHAK